jgi:hypothetical protein
MVRPGDFVQITDTAAAVIPEIKVRTGCDYQLITVAVVEPGYVVKAVWHIIGYMIHRVISNGRGFHWREDQT